MPTVVILFNDGEVMYARTPPLRFDLPVIEVEVLDPGSNCEQAILPLHAIRQLIVQDSAATPAPESLDGWDRAAFHFVDGHVLRAWVGPDALLGAHGGLWPCVEPGSDEKRTIAIPYSSLKGVFRLRSWDGRALAARQSDAPSEAQGLDQVVRILAEREVRALGHRERRSGTLLDRLRSDGLEDALAGADRPDVAGRERRRDG
ncbi:MAG TPA: hypothetical protein VFO60_05455 [Candidatus Dormibacteraeota bacterium]|nr:hypothetical protein [Candidatus Dormibacteraeota bacterium]